jgi:hypothetical protein
MSLKKRFLQDATIYNALITAVMLGSVSHNKEMWVHDYPPDIKEKYGPVSEETRRLARLWAIPFFVVILGWVIFAALRLKKADNGRLPFKAAFKYIYLLFLSFWTYDLVVLDWLIFCTIQPGFIVLPGTEGMAGYKDYAFHLKASWPFILIMALPSAIIAFFVSR